MKPENKLKRLLEKGKELGVIIEEPDESINDLVREAQSVINFFKSNGKNFRFLDCKQCNNTFSYAWNIEGVQYCSITCMKNYLSSIGINWNPNKTPSERWGNTIPAILSPEALKAVILALNNQDSPIDD